MRKGADAAQSVVSTSAGDVRDGARVLVDTLQKTGALPARAAALLAWRGAAAAVAHRLLSLALAVQVPR